jgi:long-chain acyl-CoA synthetase
MAPSTTLIEIVDGLGAHAERPALVTFGARERREWSYGYLARTVRELAADLASAGLEPGARVALFAPDGPEWIASALAVIRAGSVVVPLDAQFTDEALAHTLIDSAARLVFTTVDRAGRVGRLAPAARIVLLDAAEGGASWRDLRGPAELPPERRGADPAALFYTSGTTGPPKGVPLSHGNLTFQVNTLAGIGLVTAGDRVCLPLPLHHVYPLPCCRPSRSSWPVVGGAWRRPSGSRSTCPSGRGGGSVCARARACFAPFAGGSAPGSGC